MSRRRVVQCGALLWAVVGAAIALSSVSSVNSDARVLVGVLSAAGPVAAVVASVLLARHFDRWAGVALLVSVVTPTYFAWAANVPALLAGIALAVAPALVLPDRVQAAADFAASS